MLNSPVITSHIVIARCFVIASEAKQSPVIASEAKQSSLLHPFRGWQ